MPKNYMETSAVEKESAVTRELNNLSNASNELGLQVEQLEVRLSVILSPQPKNTSAEGKPEEMLSPIPDQIRRHRYAVDNANYMLRSILSRLEV